MQRRPTMQCENAMIASHEALKSYVQYLSERTLGPLIERRVSSSFAYVALILVMLEENPHNENHDLDPVVVVGEEKYSHAYS